jgi:hypothetical protein
MAPSIASTELTSVIGSRPGWLSHLSFHSASGLDRVGDAGIIELDDRLLERRLADRVAMDRLLSRAGAVADGTGLRGAKERLIPEGCQRRGDDALARPGNMGAGAGPAQATADALDGSPCRVRIAAR